MSITTCRSIARASDNANICIYFFISNMAIAILLKKPLFFARWFCVFFVEMA